ncbi:MAG: HD domain-containing protein [Rhodospirillales bacterium]|nr:HD domain-containing protein [Rhodospirillales bacterium]
MKRPTADTVIDYIVEIFERRGAEAYLGDAVTMSEHMLQSAANAERTGAPAVEVAAALLHDVGHFAGEFPEDMIEAGADNRHDAVGARILQPFFPPGVTEPVRLHVAAKRYLCTVDASYFGRLSPASQETFRLQGGPMTPDEVARFESERHRGAAVRVRMWDDEGKSVDSEPRPLAHYVPLLRSLLVSPPAGRR